MSYPQYPYGQGAYQYGPPGQPYPPPDPVAAPPPLPPRALKWAVNLSYLQFVAAVMGALFNTGISTVPPDGSRVPDAALLMINGGFMALLAIMCLLCAVLLPRRQSWPRVMAVVVQVGFVLALGYAFLLALDLGLLGIIFLLGPNVGAGLLAVPSLILLSRPSVSQWYDT